jgi:hypothetical protein
MRSGLEIYSRRNIEGVVKRANGGFWREAVVRRNVEVNCRKGIH